MLRNDGDDASSSVPASRGDGCYPRPQVVRPRWADLSGPWGFCHDDDDEGQARGWSRRPVGDRTITVPFPPESPASGIADTGFHPVVWYSRALTVDELRDAGLGPDAPRLLVHFGAVDYRAKVWLNGVLLGEHEGGHTPFTFDATDAVDDDAAEQLLVVRAEDDPHDVTQPRGKQDWQLDPHVIWYHRTTGIWQTVWLEAVPRTSIRTLGWTSDLPAAAVDLALELRGPVTASAVVEVVVAHDGAELGRVTVPAASRTITTRVHLVAQRNGQAYERLLWSPESPVLLDATVRLVGPAGEVLDLVDSYLGLRSVDVSDGAFRLNDRPYYVRSVLEQGYWPESHLAAPSPGALRDEVELIKSLGFNAARVHQKIEDPRFLFWADRLGLLVWGEMAGAFEFSPLAVARFASEWTEAVRRDVSHPCIVTWVPMNESWGVQHIARDPAQRAFARSMADLTRALDPSRPVISNDGWEHVSSDIISVHDYEASPAVMAERYGSATAREDLVSGHGPAGRRILLPGDTDPGSPLMLTEFGGIRYDTSAEGADDAWGYSSAGSAEQFASQLRGLLGAVIASSSLAGFCYTQLTDTRQEANGLVDARRRPKVPIEVIRAAVQAQT
ncbi:glycosyl hydrolase family 2 [Frigoribacterium sp. PhB160]|uniref:glycoside hydrolase family 2 protein n=1 Tax=Frigoribacterium sp. PhB160 TaxID=2485192 RepID=UPI000FBB40C9|nr:glycoside hydrolase family 2 TIM barrel-domain containing protein [Frigoribacterium sp. PhB160]ROS61232.1 glycosyl hydrolase family 2 [Frigoribacterium sp. PhB160]